MVFGEGGSGFDVGFCVEGFGVGFVVGDLVGDVDDLGVVRGVCVNYYAKFSLVFHLCQCYWIKVL